MEARDRRPRRFQGRAGLRSAGFPVTKTFAEFNVEMSSVLQVAFATSLPSSGSEQRRTRVCCAGVHGQDGLSRIDVSIHQLTATLPSALPEKMTVM